MRIGLIIYGRLETISGGYLYDRMLIKQLQAQGDEIIMISLPWRNYVRHLGDNLHTKLVRFCRSLHVDMLLEDELNHPSLFWLNRRLRWTLDVPLISIVHHLRMHEQHPEKQAKLYRRVETAYLNSVDGFIFNSESTRQHVAAVLNKPKPGIIAYPAADHIEPPSITDALELIKQRSHESGPLRVLAVGNVIERKNLHTLFKALLCLPVDDWTLTIVGSLATDPGYVQRLRAALETADLHPKQVTFAGGVDLATLRQHYAASHVLALPSYEGFGIVYLEAMSFGCVPIAATMGAAHEIITNEVDGFLVDPDDAAPLAARIAALNANRHQLKTMSVAARVRYDCHPTWDESMDAVYLWLHEKQMVL